MFQGCLEVQVLRSRVQAQSIAPPAFHKLATRGQANKLDQPSTRRRIDQNVQSWKSSTPHHISMIFFRVIIEVEEPGSDIRELEGLHAVFSQLSPGHPADQGIRTFTSHSVLCSVAYRACILIDRNDLRSLRRARSWRRGRCNCCADRVLLVKPPLPGFMKMRLDVPISSALAIAIPQMSKNNLDIGSAETLGVVYC
jgi:hypothetical protein